MNDGRNQSDRRRVRRQAALSVAVSRPDHEAQKNQDEQRRADWPQAEWDAAQRAAGEWEKELRSGKVRVNCNITWEDFRTRYEDERLASLAAKTDAKAQVVFDSVETIINPVRLRDLTAERLSHYQAKLRERGLAETSITGHLKYIRAALAWGVSMGLLATVPKIQFPKRGKGSKVMKGRPITGEEFERMLAKTEAVVGPVAAPSWRFYLRGLWTSGLRLGESLELYWDRDDKLCVDLVGKRPMLRIPAALEKGNQDRVLPMAPEFAELLAVVPDDQRSGPVFNPKSRQNVQRLTSWTVGDTVAAIGKLAGVKVNTDQKGVVKYASAHDLRRSFGERWSHRVMPQVLKELMRHEDINTTLAYYVGRNAERTAEALWDVHHEAAGNKTGNTEAEKATN